MSRVAARLQEAKIVLPVAPKPVANYLPFTISNNQIHLCGHLPKNAEGQFPHLGRVAPGETAKEGFVTIDQARTCAELCVINMLSTLALALEGNLDRVTKIVKINVFVASNPDFFMQPKVADAASDLLVKAFGSPQGNHARSAVGVAVLPLNVPVEIDAIVEFGSA